LSLAAAQQYARKDVTIKGNEFTVFRKRSTWEDAALLCGENGLQLATVKTAFEAARLQTIAGTYVWIGLKSNNAAEGPWRWIHGEVAEREYVSWGRIQPNEKAPEACGYIATSSGIIGDTTCEKRYMVACSPIESRSRMIFEETTSTELPDTTTPEDTTTLPPTTSTTSTTQKIPIEQLTAATFGKVLDLSGSGHRGRVRDPLVKFPGPADETSREVFVNYDTNTDGITGFTDTMDPEIEYIEADGVFMFYLDYMQNPERHCNDQWPADLTQHPMGLDSCQDNNPLVQPDMFPDTNYNEFEPACNGVPGDCSGGDTCCNVHRGLNYTRAVCKCREYGGDIATPYSQVQDQYMFDFIQSIWEYRFNTSNPRYCRNADGSVPGTLGNSPHCPIIQEGLTTATWGNELIWIGYNFNSDESKYQLVNGTLMNLDYHYWGLIGTGIDGRKRRALDDINVVDATQTIITIDNTHINGGADIVIDYDLNAPNPVCIGIRYDTDDTDPDVPHKLQWVERDCERAKSVMCEVDLRETQNCRFGNIASDDPNYDNKTKITTDAWSAAPDPCTNWQKCTGGEIVNGTCAIDEKFDTILRMCMPAITQEPCNINECNVTSHVCTGDNMHCEDTIGSYACICDPGYQWNPEKSDPTTDNPDGREPSPDNNFWVWPEGGLSPGDPGFVHDDSGLYDADLGDMCIDLDECLANELTCPANSECSNLDIVVTGRPYECVCSTGYTPVYNMTQNTTDTNGVNYYDVVSCEDVNECDWGNVTCSSVTMCVNTDGSFHCGCEVGYTTDPACNACIGNATADGYLTDPDLCATETAAAGISNCCGNINECENPILNLCPVTSDCIDNDGSFFCDCHNELEYINTDTYVCEDKDECSNATWNGCDPNSVCQNLDPSYICECNDGYDNCANPFQEIIGTCCEDRNECEKDAPCGINADCTNLVGLHTIWGDDLIDRLLGYYCNCSDGFAGEAYNACFDVDECSNSTLNQCDEESTCLNTNGNYICTCNLGFTLDGDKNEFYDGTDVRDCIDLDECLTPEFNECDGNATCTNNDGSYVCNCNPGYEGDGRTCLDIQECNDPRDNNCDTGIIRPIFADIAGVCVNENGGYVCECPEGYEENALSSIETDAEGCADVDECASDPCHADAVCTNNVGSFECECATGFKETAPLPAQVCEDIDECTEVTGVCHEDADCANDVGTYTCTCKTGYTGDGEFCADINECADPSTNGCDELAECANTDASYTCTCPDGYDATGSPAGASCDEIDECAEIPEPCDAEATCTNYPPGSFTCTCNPGYSGNGAIGNCTTVNECTDNLHNCDPQADCTDTEGSFDCTCIDGYYSLNTPPGRSGDCLDVNECLVDTDNDCHQNATCTNLVPPDRFSCACNAGFVGDGLSCSIPDECADQTHNCDPRAECTKEPGQTGFACNCTTGYTDVMTPDGLTFAALIPGLACTDIDECLITPSVCTDNALCTNTVGSYSCGCDDGFQGPDPDTCEDINECDAVPAPCAAVATCSNNPGSFTCACPTGYSGNGFICEDIDECRVLPDTGCDDGANCINSPGSFSCECRSGYDSTNGTGVTGDCTPKNECLESPCPTVGGICTDLPPEQNGYICSCEDGYQYIPNINFCEDVNECNEAPCTAGAVCTNSDPGFDCNCDTGFVQSNGTGLFSFSNQVGDATCDEINECELGISSCNLTTSICVNTFGGHLCYCKPEYIDDGFGNCVDKDECDLGLCPFPTSSNGTNLCVNFDGGYNCFCPDGFDGNVVVTPIALDTVEGEVVTAEATVYECGDRNECAVLVGEDCPVNSQCNNLPGGVSCACDPGYENNQTDSSLAPICVNINECASNHLCLASATCIDLDGSYMCQCPTGYQGDGVNFCEDADECAIAASNRRRRQAENFDNTTQTVDGAACDPTAICLNTDGSYTCQCPLGMMEDPDTRLCLDIDECASGTHTCLFDEFCLNFPGSHSCFELPRTTALPLIEGDPHIRVSAPNEEPVCFDFSDTDESVLSLISEGPGGVQVNGQVFEEGTKGKVCRLETVGVVSPGGVQVAVYVDQVTIGRDGQVYYRFYYDQAAEHGIDDVHIEVHPAEKGKNPHRGVMISIGHSGDIRFNVEYKRAKKSASLAVERGSGLKEKLSGVLGSTMHGDIDYHISKSGGIVLPNGKEIPVTMVNWNVHHNCHKMEASMVEDFLGHAISEYRVEGLFGAPSETTSSWISAFFDVFGFPKRR